MINYIVLYHAPAAALRKIRDATPEQMKLMKRHERMLMKAPERGVLWLLVAVWTLCAAPVLLAEGVVESGSGNVVTERLDFEEFTAIEVASSWEVEAVPGEFAVEVSVDDNVLDDMRVEVRGETLWLGMRAGAWFRRLTLRARVSLPELDGLQVTGSGHITAREFEAPALQIGVSGSGGVAVIGCRVGALDGDISGTGDINAEGCMIGTAALSISGSGDVAVGGEAGCAGDNVSLRISGSGSADLRSCMFTDAQIRISGSGNVLLMLGNGDLTGRITGSGSVTYHGSPARVDVRTSGSGRVVKEG